MRLSQISCQALFLIAIWIQCGTVYIKGHKACRSGCGRSEYELWIRCRTFM
ncbi:hypothetical protein Hanom_Chr12g01092121 [Helianthus anomalus]